MQPAGPDTLTVSDTLTPHARLRACKLPLESSTSWWKGLGHWPKVSISCPSRGLWGLPSAFWRGTWSRRPPLRARHFDQPVEDLLVFPNFRAFAL
jgi:hypothetical protein